MYFLEKIQEIKNHGLECPCCQHPERRRFLKLTGAISATGILLGPKAVMASQKKDRTLMMANPHTGEMLRTVYWTPIDGYIKESLDSISYFMRDFRLNQVKPVDPALMDIVHAISLNIGRNKKFEVMSGYRSPKTNRMLSRRSKNVAKKSMHMSAKAIDFQVKGVSAQNLRKIALALKAGGVGYYPGSRYIHVDTGSVRTWVYS